MASEKVFFVFTRTSANGKWRSAVLTGLISSNKNPQNLPPKLLCLGQICTKSFFTDPTVETYSAPPGPLAVLG